MDSSPEFTLAEMREMENIVKEIREESLFPEFCKGLASTFSFSPNRSGKPAITWQQVQSWFKDRLKQSEPTFDSFPEALNLRFNLSATNIPCFAPESSQKTEGKRASPSDLTELMFEARSSKDYAWYDVACFLNYRVTYVGELEVRVRFSGYGHTEDEWVNMRRAVRERSIPLEPSECNKIKIGDPVLCFQERPTQAIYLDAHIVGVQRRLHDTSGCTCIFVVRYDIDFAEEKVKLQSLCIRPTS